METEEIHIDEATLKEVEKAIKKARFEGWESEDGFLLATGFLYK
jgi:hypothetical protein